MDLQRYRIKHQADHYSDMQAVESIRLAIASVEDGLQTLAGLGHLYHLEPGPAPPQDDWPRVLFHVEAAPNGRIVNSPYDAYELGAGWYGTLQEAQHAEGVRAQFAGRGGIQDRSVPMLVGAIGPQPEHEHRNDNKAVIEQWKRENGNGNERK